MMFICRRPGGCRVVGDDHPIAKAFEAMMQDRDKRDMERVDGLSSAQRAFAEGLTRAVHRRRYRDGAMPARHKRRSVIPIEGVYVIDYLTSDEGQAALQAMGAEMAGDAS